MKLNPVDIIKQDFPTKFFGFDKNETRSFLKLVSTEYEEVANENVLLKKQITEKDNEIRLINETREEIKGILNTLQRISEGSLEKGEEIIKAINNEVRGGLMELSVNLLGFRGQLTEAATEAGFTNKEELKRFVTNIQQVKREEKERAETESGLIIRDAQLQAKEIVKNAEDEADKIRMTISELKKEYNLLKQRLRKQIESSFESLSPDGEE
jgi:cell division septum initiation protein DivIVA